jgi:hypothetical protein
MTGTKLKPFNADAGYVCMINTPFGCAVVYDRENGGDWIDAGERWVTVAYDKDQAQISMVSSQTQKLARDTMKGAREFGFKCDWAFDQATKD